MLGRAAPLFISLAVMPMAAHAQSANNGGQELISDLQKNHPETRDVKQIKVLQKAESQNVSTVGQAEFQIGAILVVDEKGVSHPEFGPVIEDYIGTVATQSDLQAILGSIAGFARKQGYIFATAILPEQSVTIGMLKVVVDFGRVDQVQIVGSDNPHLRTLLSGLEGKYAQKRDIERRLLLARDISGISIVDTQFNREGGSGILLVTAKDLKPSMGLAFDNYGERLLGPLRGRFDADLPNLLDDDDTLFVQAITTPAEPKELTFVSARYSNLLSSNGTQVSVTGAAGRNFQDFGALNGTSHSVSRYLSAGLSQPLLRSNDLSLWLNTDFSYLEVNQSYSASSPLHDRVTTLATSLSGNVKVIGGRLSGGVSVTRGLDLFGATQSGELDTSRIDGSGVFTKGQIWLNWFGLLGDGFSLRVAGNGQIASEPLLASQEMGIGGAGVGRAFKFYERYGENGGSGLVEVRRAFDKPTNFMDWLQFYTFVDGGYVDNLDGFYGGGKLLSGGGGFRSGLGKAELGLEIAVPIEGIRSETLDRSPRINFTAGIRF